MPELGARPANSPSQSGAEELGAQRFDAAHIAGQVAALQRMARYEFAAGLVAGRAVLDAACGFGDGTEVLVAAGATSVSAVDARAVMIEAAKSRLGEAAALAVAQPDALAFADDTFDVVVRFGPDDLAGPGDEELVELVRVLRPGGVLATSAQTVVADQLAQRLRSRFGHVRGFTQHDCLASLVALDGDATIANTRVDVSGHSSAATVFVVSDSPPPDESPATALLGPAAAVDTWIETAAAQDAALLELQGRLTALAPQNTREAHERLIELEQRLAEAERERFAAEQRHRWAQEAVDGMAGSLSWRITAPLRRLRRDRG